MCAKRAEYDELGTDADPIGFVVGQRVRALREAAEMTKTELAKRLGTSSPNVLRLEAGRHVPRLDLLADVAFVLGVRITDLVASVDALNTITPGTVSGTNEGTER